MEKYKVMKKVGKCRQCTFYQGQSIANRQFVILKKINRSTNWQQILKSKQLAVIKNSKIKLFPSVHEIVKDDDRFYIVMDFMEENLQTVIPQQLSHEEILKISRLLIQTAIGLRQQAIVPLQLRPSYFFLSGGRNVLKLAHLETSKPKDLSKLDLVQLQDMKYMSPQQVLTANQPCYKSNIFRIGLIIYELITGKPLLTANTKINYIFQLCRLFPEQYINIGEQIKDYPPSSDQTFQKLMHSQNISNQMIAMLSQMLRLNKNQRIDTPNLLDSFDIIAQNQLNFQKNRQRAQFESKVNNKPNSNQVDINNTILKDTQFQFESKSTLSTQPIIRDESKPLPFQMNIDDDAVQPIIIKQSSKPFQKGNSKQTAKQTRSTQNNPSFSTIRRPQLTNYAMNQANLGVQVGINPTLFSDNDF